MCRAAVLSVGLAGLAPGARADELAPRASEGAWRQRVELVGRETARLKGELAAGRARQAALEARPTLEACVEASVASQRIQEGWNRLLDLYTGLGSMAAPWPERRAHVEHAVATCRSGRDAALDHSLALAERCRGLPPADALVPPPADAPTVLCGPGGLEVDGGVGYLVEPGAVASGRAGLVAARRVVGTLAAPPVVLVVRVVDPAAADPASANGHSAARGASLAPGTAGGWSALVAEPGPLRAVVVVSAGGSVVDTPILRTLIWALSGGQGAPPGEAAVDLEPFPPDALAHLGLRAEAVPAPPPPTGPVAAAAASPPPTGPAATAAIGLTALLVVVSARPVPPAERARLRADWHAFARPGADARIDRLNFAEATGGRVFLAPAPLDRRAPACTSGSPDLP